MRYKAIVLLTCFYEFLCSAPVTAQNKAAFDQAKIYKQHKSFFDSKIGMPFNPIDEWHSLNAGQFDMFKANGPIIFFLGFESCVSCRTALPAFAELSTEPGYADYKFVYMTFDDTATIRKEISGLKPGNRVIALPVSRDYIQQVDLVRGYPTVYFIDSKKVVKNVWAYGADTTGNLASKNSWYPKLDRLK